MAAKNEDGCKYNRPILRALKATDPIFSVKIRQVELAKYAKSVGKAHTELSKNEIGRFVVGGYEKLEEYRGF